MRNIKWLRYGLAFAGIACGASAALLAACGDDDSGVTANNDGGGNDANNNTDGNNNTDASKTDGGDGGKTPTPAKIVVVHAATDYGSGNPSGIVRVCYATKTATDPDFTLSPLPPLPHSKDVDSTLPFPGIPIGAGGPFPSTGLPLEGIAIRPFVISGQALAERGVIGTTGTGASVRCNSLLKTGGFVPDGGFPDAGDAGSLTENQDYWKLADIPAGTFKNEKTYILAITGCTADTNATTFFGKCGPDPANASAPYVPPQTPGVGNLKIAVLEIDATSTIATDEMGVQVVHLSPQYQFLRNATDGGVVRPFQPVFGKDYNNDLDGGYDAATNVKVGNAEIAFNTTSATALAKLKGIVTTTGYFAANDDDALSSGPFIPIPLNNAGNVDPANGKFTIQYLSEGKTVPNTAPAYTNGKAYTFVLVGDPQGSSLRKIHFLAFPNQFTPPPAQ